ncbi:MAG: fibronectin type III domain-containing protein [Candidatus Bathyarchaeota archaeon]|nr:fibronectin type III domain-containing protein [Candidatus Bathyarchaeota archaeon]
MRRIVKVALVVPVIIAVLFVGVYFVGRNTTILMFPEVWSQSSPYGESYEFKVNDFQGDPDLESGFLITIDRVVVTDPLGREYELEKDFNINEYSGEVTKRFVLYGPEDGGLPVTGEYRFDFIKDGETVLTKHVDYTQSNLMYPTDVSWERRGSDIYVEWTPPPNVNKNNWYKVLIWSTGDTPSQFVSLRFDGDASSGLLEDVPFVEGGTYQLNVAVFSGVGYAYSEYHNFVWDREASPITG